MIPARYGSSRFPGKPLVPILGKPLIQWVYERAVKSKADLVMVATDSERIAECVSGFGGRWIMTSKECASGSDRVAEAVKKEGESWEFVVNVQGDEPLIEPGEIDRVFDALEEHPDCIVTLATKIDDEEDYKDPNVVKVVFDNDGCALYFSRSPIPFFRKRSTDAYRHIGIYGFHRDVLMRFVSTPRGRLEAAEELEQLRALEAGIPILVLETDYKGIGVDVPRDVERVEKLLRGE